MGKTCRSKRWRKPSSRASLVSARARLSHAQINKLLESYARRNPPREAAKAAGLSLNSVYRYYRHLRERLAASGYYRNGALSWDEPGLSPQVRDGLRARRGLRGEDIYAHAAELIDWAEAWPPPLVLKHIRTILALTGPLDAPALLSETEMARLQAYVRHARTELIYDRRNSAPVHDEAQQESIARAKTALDQTWRAYRTACKRLERERRKTLGPHMYR